MTSKKSKENKTNTIASTIPELEVKVNDRIRILFRVDQSMDPTAFLEMVNHVKAFVKVHAPEGSIQDRGMHESRIEKMKEAAVLFKKGLSEAEVAKKMGKSESTISHWRGQMKQLGLI